MRGFLAGVPVEFVQRPVPEVLTRREVHRLQFANEPVVVVLDVDPIVLRPLEHLGYVEQLETSASERSLPKHTVLLVVVLSVNSEPTGTIRVVDTFNGRDALGHCLEVHE